jgi:uncharacterized SAM-binding protein YcdF (DUF218 family)
MALFVWPPADAPARADALVILGPGLNGERFSKGLAMIRRRLAPVVVVSESRRPARWPIEQRLCAEAGTICFRAEPFTTRAEARAVARLAQQHHWHRLLLVTSTYHVVRARLLYGRCFDGQIRVVAAHPGAGFIRAAKTAVHETAGLLYALVFARGC